MVGRNRWTFRFSSQLQGLQRHRGNKSVGSLNGWQVLFSIRRQLRCPRKARCTGGAGVAGVGRLGVAVGFFLNLGRWVEDWIADIPVVYHPQKKMAHTCQEVGFDFEIHCCLLVIILTHPSYGTNECQRGSAYWLLRTWAQAIRFYVIL